MADFDKTNTFALFNNAQKYKDKFPERDTSSWPTHGGTINVDGKEYEIAAWVKTSKAGNKYMSGVVKPIYVKPDAEADPKEEAKLADDFDDDIPF